MLKDSPDHIQRCKHVSDSCSAVPFLKKCFFEKVWKHLDRLSGRSMGRMAARTPHVIRKTRRARSWRVIRLTLSSVIGLLNSNMHAYIDTVIDQSCYAHIKYRTFVNYIIKIYTHIFFKLLNCTICDHKMHFLKFFIEGFIELQKNLMQCMGFDVQKFPLYI